MIRVTAEVEVYRPSEAVFAYLSDFENNPRWQGGMREARFTSEPPLRAGSTYDQVATFLGRRIVSSFEVVALEPGRSISIATTQSSFPIRVTRRVEPIDAASTRVTAEIEGDATGFFRVASPILRWIVQRSVRKDYANLKRVLESDAEEPPPAADAWR